MPDEFNQEKKTGKKINVFVLKCRSSSDFDWIAAQLCSCVRIQVLQITTLLLLAAISHIETTSLVFFNQFSLFLGFQLLIKL